LPGPDSHRAWLRREERDVGHDEEERHGPLGRIKEPPPGLECVGAATNGLTDLSQFETDAGMTRPVALYEYYSHWEEPFDFATIGAVGERNNPWEQDGSRRSLVTTPGTPSSTCAPKCKAATRGALIWEGGADTTLELAAGRMLLSENRRGLFASTGSRAGRGPSFTGQGRVALPEERRPRRRRSR
jgi:hypothetical protein